MKIIFRVLLCCCLLNTTLFGIAQQHGNRGGCYNTTWPLDMANSNRSNCVTNCGFSSNFDTSQITYSNISLPYPVFSYSRDTNEVFVMGGCPLILYNYCGAIETGNPTSPNSSYSSQFTPYIAKLDINNLTAETLNLSGGNSAPYIGGAVVHANGFIYAIASGRLFKIQSEPFQELISTNLPVSGLSQLNFFNGLAVSNTGRIIAKAYNQINGDGYFFLIDENNLNVIYQLPAAMASPRLTVDIKENKEYIYHLNQNETYRIEVKNDSLIKDSTWTSAYDPYNDGTVDEPTSPVVLGNKVLYTTNTLYSATRAMKIFWQNKDLSYNNTDTLGGSFLHSDSLSSGWSFFHLSVDDSLSGIIIGNDQGQGKISAGIIDSNNNYNLLWERNIKTSARPVIVADRNLVYVTDFFNGFDHLVVLDLQSGQEKGRIKTDATKPTIGTIIITPDDYVIYASNEYGNATGLINIFKQDQILSQADNSFECNEAVLFPNPFDCELYVNSPFQNYSIKIYDVYGSLIYNKSNISNPHHINSELFAPGNYKAVIEYSGVTFTRSLTKTK
jgi:hypothetical protein